MFLKQKINPMQNGTPWRRVIRVIMMFGGGGLMTVSACNGTLGREFRTVAGDSVEQGVTSIVNGVLDGLFAVVQPDASSTD